MKFWQLIDVFRDEKYILEKLFSNAKWRRYLEYYNNIPDLIQKQNREILDMHVDDELLKEICLESKKVLYYSSSKNSLYNYQSGFSEKQIPIRDAILLFNHDTIEEVFEKSESVAKRL